MMVKFACEFVTVLGTGEQFQRSFSSCFRYERLGKSRFVRVHACTVTPQTDAATLSIVVTRAITLIEICADPGNHWFSPSRTRARTGRHFVPHLSVVGTTSIPLSEILFHAIPLVPWEVSLVGPRPYRRVVSTFLPYSPSSRPTFRAIAVVLGIVNVVLDRARLALASAAPSVGNIAQSRAVEQGRERRALPARLCEVWLTKLSRQKRIRQRPERLRIQL
jgi:hypothetical protein